MLAVTPERRCSTVGADALERDVGVALARVREQQRELVAPEPERAVAGARVAQQLGELAQQAVAVLVAVAVVLELEVVDVEQRERDRGAVAQRLPDRAGELVLEGTMVVEVGQPVAARALQGGAVEHADAPAAEQVEERQRDQQAQHHEQPEAVAERRDARLQRLAGAVLGEHDVAVEQLERDDVGVGLAVGGQGADDRLAACGRPCGSADRCAACRPGRRPARRARCRPSRPRRRRPCPGAPGSRPSDASPR